MNSISMVYDLVVMWIYVIMTTISAGCKLCLFLLILREYTFSIKNVALECKLNIEINDEY
jgi:hypothetical protein